MGRTYHLWGTLDEWNESSKSGLETGGPTWHLKETKCQIEDLGFKQQVVEHFITARDSNGTQNYLSEGPIRTPEGFKPSAKGVSSSMKSTNGIRHGSRTHTWDMRDTLCSFVLHFFKSCFSSWSCVCNVQSVLTSLLTSINWKQCRPSSDGVTFLEMYLCFLHCFGLRVGIKTHSKYPSFQSPSLFEHLEDHRTIMDELRAFISSATTLEA